MFHFTKCFTDPLLQRMLANNSTLINNYRIRSSLLCASYPLGSLTYVVVVLRQLCGHNPQLLRRLMVIFWLSEV